MRGPGKNLSFVSECKDLEPGELVLKEVRGHEAMSRLYEYELTLEARQAEGLPWQLLDGVLKHRCRLEQSGDVPLSVHGVLKSLELHDPAAGVPARYTAVLVPELWQATRTYRSRIYQNMNVQALCDKVLSGLAVKARWYLSRDYPVQEYVVQFEESDFDFLSRQLEHWGIFYYFKQTDAGTELVLSDHGRQFTALEGHEALNYDVNRARGHRAGAVHSLRAVFVPQPAIVMERDYNWRTPSTKLAVAHPVDQRTGKGLQWHFGEHYGDENEGRLIASIRAEQLLNRRESYRGSCSVPGLRPGHKFELMDCPAPELNMTYLVTSVTPRFATASGTKAEEHEYDFTAYPLERQEPPVVPYRSQRVTRKPKVHGFVHGFIDGEVKGSAAPIDRLGRYTVILPMDTADAEAAHIPGKASRRIRMAQPSSGENYGVHFPLHVGAEVAISHVDGDPDRPVIMGAVPNAETVSPVVEGNATQSRIRSKSGILVELEDDISD